MGIMRAVGKSMRSLPVRSCIRIKKKEREKNRLAFLFYHNS